MKIAFHSFQLGERGTEVAMYKYAKYNREILSNESIIVSTSSRPTPGYMKFKDFEIILYPEVFQGNGQNDHLRQRLESICEKHKVDAFYAIKGGENDNIMPTNTKTLSHCVFRADQPHGDVYATICKYMSEKHGGIHPYVHHVIEKEAPHITEDFREVLRIPKDAVVFGRYGGTDQFSLPFVYSTIKQALDARPDIWFIFLNTNLFYTHERIVYLPMEIDVEYKAKFVNTCDAMLHARLDGEVMSMSVAEFSSRNRPIITWKPTQIPQHHDTGHLYLLKDNAIYYKDGHELLEILLGVSKTQLNEGTWDSYCQDYTPQKVMQEFKQVYLE